MVTLLLSSEPAGGELHTLNAKISDVFILGQKLHPKILTSELFCSPNFLSEIFSTT